MDALSVRIPSPQYMHEISKNYVYPAIKGNVFFHL